MLTNIQKKEIVTTILQEKNRIGSANKLATKCAVSSAIISQMLNSNWQLISDDMWMKVSSKIGHKFTNWNIATNTTNYKTMQKVLNDAQKECMFIPISYRAGSGKSEGLKGFLKNNSSEFLYHMTCREWAKREFIENLMLCVGMEIPRGYYSIDKLGQKLIDFFIDRKSHKPFLALDQANSLKPSALKFLIHLYNAMSDAMSVVIIGTEALEKEIKRGVQYNKAGYDEIDSRFGRNYIHLIGATRQDISKICEVNGIANKKLQKNVFTACNPTVKKVGNQMLKVVEDMRRVKRVIKRELLMLKAS